MTVRELQEKQRQLRYTYEQIAHISGIPLDIVREVLEGEKIPDKAILEALEMVFEIEESTGDSVQEVLCEKTKNVDFIREAQTAYRIEKRQGEYTIEDYFAIREECRVELIDGVLYDMASPHWIHQEIGFLIGMELHLFVKRRGGTCLISGGPVSTQLDCDDKTMLEPDITVVCDRSKLQKGYIYGAPDMVIEILSKSTAKRDKTVKKAKYQKAGVREYWIVDPKRKTVIVHFFEKGDTSRIYHFEEQIPVGIFDGECKIDFSEIYKEVEFLYEE